MNDNPDTNFKILDRRSPDTQARVAEMPVSEGESPAELLPCAHCGKKGSTMRHSPFQRRCLLCGAEGPEARTPEEADCLWNRRTPEPGTSVARWVTIDMDDPTTYPAMCTHVLVAVDGGAEYMFYSVRPDRREWINEFGERFMVDSGDRWACLPMPPEDDA